MTDRAELRRLAEEARSFVESIGFADQKGKWFDLHDAAFGIPSGADKFIAAANPTTVLELLDRVEELEKENGGLRKKLLHLMPGGAKGCLERLNEFLESDDDD